MPKCILSGQVKSTFTQEQADGRYIQMTNGATTTLASSLQVSGINNIEFTEEGEDPITASNVSYSNTTSGMTSGNVQNAIDELFQSVSEGKSLIAAAVTDKGVETAATDSFATMAGNIGQISSGGGGGETVTGTISGGVFVSGDGYYVYYVNGDTLEMINVHKTAETFQTSKNSIIFTTIPLDISGASGSIEGIERAGYAYFVTGNFSANFQ